MSDVTTSSVTRCNLSVSNKLKRTKTLMADEIEQLLQSSTVHNVYIERLPDGKHSERKLVLYFDVEEIQGTPAIECEWIATGLEVVNYYVTRKNLFLGNNRQLHLRMMFDRKGLVSPENTLLVYRLLQSIPIAAERSEYVKKRVSGWEAYLRVMEDNADVEKAEVTIQRVIVNKEFTKLTVQCSNIPKQFDKYYSKSAVKLVNTNESIGKVVQVQMGKRTIDIELTRELQTKLRLGRWQAPQSGKLAFDNIAELTQINRLKDGFKRLENGLAVHPNLEKLLFDERPVVRFNKRKQPLELKQNLNEYQRQAVEGAIDAQDLYLIQGPPGTGKTTVITEICYQHAKMGLRTLVASQSNLAVDNALGKLMVDPDIRILRIGRSESIEEEGKRFVEEQVALYWKEQTLATMKTQVGQYEEDAQSLQLSIEQKLALKDELLLQQKDLQQKLEEQKEAKQKLIEVESELATLLEESKDLERKKKPLQFQLSMSEDLWRDAQMRLQKEQQKQLQFSQDGEFEKMKQSLVEQVKLHEETLKHLQTTVDIEKLSVEAAKFEGELKEVISFIEKWKEASNKIQEIKKASDLYEIVRQHSFMPDVMHHFQQLEDLKARIIKMQNSPLLEEKLKSAITYAKNMLNSLSVNISKVENINITSFDDGQIQKALSKLREYVKEWSSKQNQLTTAEKQTLLKAYEYLLALYKGRLNEVEQLKEKSRQIFQQLKGNVESLLVQKIEQVTLKTQEIKVRIEQVKSQIAVLQNKLITTTKHIDGVINEIEEASVKLTQQLEELGTEQEYLQKIEDEIKRQNENLQKREREKENVSMLLQQLSVEITECEQSQQQLQMTIESLQRVLIQDIASEYEQTVGKYNENVQQMEQLERQQTFLQVSNEIRLEWQQMLEQATEYDLEEMKKLYIQYANVIGVTCSISASKDFVNQYPDFDVVIIDEVSKATPPELLLPMLKGKKIILVGDHHQLPPLIGQDTLDEVLESMEDANGKTELKSIIKESIFERLFRELPKESKTTLRIQYRMHEHIMETINPFYLQTEEGLSCGLANSNKDRDHLLEGRYVKRGQHLMWFDIPNEKGYLEEQESHNRSYYNSAELDQIRELLVDLNDATAKAKEQGIIDPESKKKVGIISFYGEQVKRIDRLLSQELHLPHLHCRTGTVDKFQGMEMDVIVVSFVRNHLQQEGNIGFLTDYRRLNVALSRAKELLMIVGSVDMFTKRVKKTTQRAMFEHVAQVTEKYGGLKQLTPK